MSWNDHEELKETASALRRSAQLSLSDGVESYILLVRRFASAANQALGEISTDEAWQGIERVSVGFFMGILQDQSNIGAAVALLERSADMLDDADLDDYAKAAEKCRKLVDQLKRG